MLGHKNKIKNEHLKMLDNNIIRVGFLSPFSECGSTFLATSLALYLGSLWKADLLNRFQPCPNTFVDMSMNNDETSFYDKYDMGKKLELELKNNEDGHGTRLTTSKIFNGVRWIISSDSSKVISEEIRREALNYKFGNIIIYDFGRFLERESELRAMDIVIGVIDPLNSKLLKYKERLEAIKNLRDLGKCTYFVVNKFNEGVSKRDIRRLLDGGDIKYFPEVPLSKVYIYDLEKRFLWEDKQVKKLIEELFSSIDLLNLYLS